MKKIMIAGDSILKGVVSGEIIKENAAYLLK